MRIQIRWIDKARNAFVFACPRHPGTAGRAESLPDSNNYLARCLKGCRFSFTVRADAE
jgi:hypothetical protein